MLLCAADLGQVPVRPELLDELERARAGRYRDAAARRRFLARRAWARGLVADVLGADPAGLSSAFRCPTCGAGDHGRPGYLLDGAPVPLGLSTSSAGDVAVAALWTPAQVAAGVDVTPVAADLEAVAEQFFTPAERAHVAGASDPAERRRRAALVWSAKEALAKAAGTGLAVDPGSLETGGAPSRRGARWRPVLAWNRLEPGPGAEDRAAFAARLAEDFAVALALSRERRAGRD